MPLNSLNQSKSLNFNVADDTAKEEGSVVCVMVNRLLFVSSICGRCHIILAFATIEQSLVNIYIDVVQVIMHNKSIIGIKLPNYLCHILHNWIVNENQLYLC